MKTPIFQSIAKKIQARQNCINSKNYSKWCKHENAILDLIKQTAPSGSGIDCGTKIELDLSNENKLVFNLSYHHMNENGMYDGWTEHQVIVTPSLTQQFQIRITGKDRNEIKDYLRETYAIWLSQETEI